MKNPIPAIAVAFLALALTPNAAADDDVFSLQPCDRPGHVGVLHETGYATVPYWGAYWQDTNVRTAGESHNVTVWKSNYDVAGRCVAAVDVTVGRGPSSPCPPAGSTATLTSAKAFIVEDTYWGPDGHLYARGYDQSYAANTYNVRAGGSCAPGAQFASGTPEPRNVCLTCKPRIDADDADTLP